MSKFERIDPTAGEPVKAELDFADPELREAFSTEDPEAVGEAFESAYRERLSEWRVAKAEYHAAKTAYETRLAEYYRNYSDKSIFGRSSQRLSEWWSGQPEDLTALEAEFKAARSAYAEGLQDVLAARGEQRIENVNFDASSTQTRSAFAQRFILEPKQDRLKVEKEHLHAAETVEHAQQILQTLQKHKWTVRVGAVTATGLLVGSGAGVAAGMAAGGVKAGRIALGAIGGTIGARIGDRIGREGVEDANAGLERTQREALEQFSVADIDRLETALLDAQSTVDTKERAHKYKVIAGALIGGGSLANLDSIGDVMVSEAHAAIPDDPFHGTGDNSLAGSIDAEVNAGLDAQAATADAEAEALAAETMEALRDTTPVADHTIERGDVLWNITKESYAHQLEGLSETQQNQVLDAVFDRLRADPALTEALGVKSGNIDLIYENDVLHMSTISDLVATEMDRLSAPIPEGAAEVASGDTLWHLTKDAYAEQLEGLSHTQQNQVLDGVFDAVRSDPRLIEELGVESGNIDLIRPNEVMHLDRLAELIDREVARVTDGATPSDGAAPTAEILREGPTDMEHLEPTEVVERGETVDAPRASADPALAETDVITAAERAEAVATLELPEALAETVLQRYGTAEAFQAAKLAAIEDIVGEQPPTWGGGERFNPMFEKIKRIPLSALAENGLDEIPRLEQPNIDQFLSRAGMDLSDSNRVDLQTWHGFYRDLIQPEQLKALGISVTPEMTFNHLFTEYVLRTPQP